MFFFFFLFSRISSKHTYCIQKYLDPRSFPLYFLINHTKFDGRTVINSVLANSKWYPYRFEEWWTEIHIWTISKTSNPQIFYGQDTWRRKKKTLVKKTHKTMHLHIAKRLCITWIHFLLGKKYSYFLLPYNLT